MRIHHEPEAIYRNPEGDAAGRLIDALSAAAAEAGAEIRQGTAVSRIIVDPGSGRLEAKGVELASGETIEARRVISSADPKTTFLELVGVRHLDIGFTNRIGRIRSDGDRGGIQSRRRSKARSRTYPGVASLRSPRMVSS